MLRHGRIAPQMLWATKVDPKLFEINKNHMPNEGYLKSLMEDEKILKLNLSDVKEKNE